MVENSHIVITVNGVQKGGKSTFAQVIQQELLNRGVQVEYTSDSPAFPPQLRQKVEAFKAGNGKVIIKEETIKVPEGRGNMECKVVHSESKSAWNVVGTMLGGKYKLARVPYNTDPRMSYELNEKERKEALGIAQFIAICLNRKEDVEYSLGIKK